MAIRRDSVKRDAHTFFEVWSDVHINKIPREKFLSWPTFSVYSQRIVNSSKRFLNLCLSCDDSCNLPAVKLVFSLLVMYLILLFADIEYITTYAHSRRRIVSPSHRHNHLFHHLFFNIIMIIIIILVKAVIIGSMIII